MKNMLRFFFETFIYIIYLFIFNMFIDFRERKRERETLM